MRSIDSWFAEYGESHQHRVNKGLHWICVPLILLSVLAFLWILPVPPILPELPGLNWATGATVAAMLYYYRLSPRLSIGVGVVLIVMLLILAGMQRTGLPIGGIFLVVFILAWAGQFIGHQVEGRRPSFFKDLQFLLIGPLWLAGSVYRYLGIRYS